MEHPGANDAYQRFVNSPLVPMTLRVAVAGHRHHPAFEQQTPELLEAIRRVYKVLDHSFQQCQQHEFARGLYSNEPGMIRLISSLAEGADQLLLRPELVAQTYQLSCILPFNADEYANDFSDAPLTSYRQFLTQAGYATPESRVLELDGIREEAELAYRHCGHLLTKNCDLLIALYDGKERPGYGTSWTVRKALNGGVPVIWIDINQPDNIDFLHRKGSKIERKAFGQQELNHWLEHLLLFTNVMRRRQADREKKVSNRILQRFAQYSDESKLKLDRDITPDFCNTGPIQSDHSRFNPLHYGYALLRYLFARGKNTQQQLKAFYGDSMPSSHFENCDDAHIAAFANPCSHGYYAAYLRADRLASMYATMHRSIFIFIYLLGASALIIAALAIAVADKTQYGNLSLWCGLAELLILSLIFMLYKQDHRQEFHEKWLEYRCIAEFLRPTLYLSAFGSIYPMRRFRDNEETIGRNRLGHGGPERVWAYLYVETLLRWIGFTGHRIDPPYLQKAIVFTRSQWLGKQYDYHTANAFYMKLIGSRLAKVSERMFWTTMVVIGAKITLSLSSLSAPWLSKTLGVLATWLPVFGTTAFAIRNHAEFEISAQRSLSTRETLLGYNRKLLELKRQNGQVAHIDELLTELTDKTISETADWLEIYEVKDTETA